MLRIALPNKGSLSDDAVTLVREAGYSCRRSGRELTVTDAANDVEFVFLRPRDIAVYVSNGTLEMGITGRDLATDSGLPFAELMALQFGGSTFRYAVPAGSGMTPDGFGGKRIATSYGTLVRADLQARGVAATIVDLDGAVEVSVRLGIADAIADVVESGRTLKEAGLETVGEPILKSEAILIGRNEAVLGRTGARIFLERLRGIVVAREYVMVEYDCPKEILQTACDVTPGIESPTISPLSEDGWVAVKSMSKRREANAIIDRLADLGAKGIIVTRIHTCRI